MARDREHMCVHMSIFISSPSKASSLRSWGLRLHNFMFNLPGKLPFLITTVEVRLVVLTLPFQHLDGGGSKTKKFKAPPRSSACV